MAAESSWNEWRCKMNSTFTLQLRRGRVASMTPIVEHSFLDGVRLGCSTCLLVFGCWELSHVIFSQAEKKRTACQAEQFQKMTTIFTQNGPRLSF